MCVCVCVQIIYFDQMLHSNNFFELKINILV